MTEKRFTKQEVYDGINRYQINDSNFIIEILDDGIPMHYSTIVNRLNEQHETIQRLKEQLKNSYMNEICEVCKHGKYSLDWYGEGDFECLKRHFGVDDWKCDGLKECDDFELDDKVYLE